MNRNANESNRNLFLVLGLVLVVLGIASFSAQPIIGAGLLITAIVVLIAVVSRGVRPKS
ncbi:hypothetical protein [Nakamurella antarctica]|uniref:hypothetical protein n=1 Tax=Nakamurella antarctica TaxID=1902245 RepID=UPI0013DE1F82|nr:hypothetical protein [Nakamurella antarctica]